MCSNVTWLWNKLFSGRAQVTHTGHVHITCESRDFNTCRWLTQHHALKMFPWESLTEHMWLTELNLYQIDATLHCKLRNRGILPECLPLYLISLLNPVNLRQNPGRIYNAFKNTEAQKGIDKGKKSTRFLERWNTWASKWTRNRFIESARNSATFWYTVAVDEFAVY